MRFFFDNGVSPKIVAILTLLDERRAAPELTHLRERFPQNADDPDWMRSLAREGSDWIIISGDPKISRAPAERKAWIESGMTAFFLGEAWASREIYTQVAEMVKAWRNIVREAKRAPRGTGFMVAAGSGRITRIYQPDA